MNGAEEQGPQNVLVLDDIVDPGAPLEDQKRSPTLFLKLVVPLALLMLGIVARPWTKSPLLGETGGPELYQRWYLASFRDRLRESGRFFGWTADVAGGRILGFRGPLAGLVFSLLATVAEDDVAYRLLILSGAAVCVLGTWYLTASLSSSFTARAVAPVLMTLLLFVGMPSSLNGDVGFLFATGLGLVYLGALVRWRRGESSWVICTLSGAGVLLADARFGLAVGALTILLLLEEGRFARVFVRTGLLACGVLALTAFWWLPYISLVDDADGLFVVNSQVPIALVACAALVAASSLWFVYKRRSSLGATTILLVGGTALLSVVPRLQAPGLALGVSVALTGAAQLFHHLSGGQHKVIVNGLVVGLLVGTSAYGCVQSFTKDQKSLPGTALLDELPTGSVLVKETAGTEHNDTAMGLLGTSLRPVLANSQQDRDAYEHVKSLLASPETKGFTLGVQQLRVLGVRYLLTNDAQLIDRAGREVELRRVAAVFSPANTTLVWELYEIRGWGTVVPLQLPPKVVSDTQLNTLSWLQRYPQNGVDPTGRLFQLSVGRGYKAWGTKEYPKSDVLDLTARDEGLLFGTSRIGAPVAVHMTYGVHWEIRGASMVRSSTNQFVLIPNAAHVEMTFAHPGTERFGAFLSLLALVALTGFFGRSRIQHMRRRSFETATGVLARGAIR